MQKLLLPLGRLWKLDSDSLLASLFVAIGDELVRVSSRAFDLITEADPRKTTELLPEFEKELAITASGSDGQRRTRIVARLIQRQRVRPVDYQTSLAGLLGQAAVDVVVIETSRADAIAMADDKEIYRFYIYRDPTDPGNYDLSGAQSLVDDITHTHAKGTVIESNNFLCDDPYSLCDRDILGI